MITKQWLEQHKTDKGGWTATQLAAIGLSWPPAKGWNKQIIGRRITPEQVAKFESGWVRKSNRKRNMILKTSPDSLMKLGSKS